MYLWVDLRHVGQRLGNISAIAQRDWNRLKGSSLMNRGDL